ncbi:hypothetical protein FNF29_07907 [Cafeteria roenbergensis]|uniref:Carrier domain-containing protein n=1 Tax=Cafeteria roenbergensis TaxID=33653 RepID=A0A5A8C1P9_CAFRO|nr:hypothetical protein FNF29_07907 [Cafeteria roenbergensis]|eukprot:KAA0146665.1 hypothetical protein FNF29_07907 [Cafeteria roenbergensis]
MADSLPLLAPQDSYQSGLAACVSEREESILTRVAAKPEMPRVAYAMVFPEEPPFAPHPNDPDIESLLAGGGLEVLTKSFLLGRLQWTPLPCVCRPAEAGAARRTFDASLPSSALFGDGGAVFVRVAHMARRRWRHNWVAHFAASDSTAELAALHPHLPTISGGQRSHVSNEAMDTRATVALCEARGSHPDAWPAAGSPSRRWCCGLELPPRTRSVCVVVGVLDAERSVPLVRSTYVPGLQWPMQSSLAKEADSTESREAFQAGKPYWEAPIAPAPTDGSVASPTEIEPRPWYDFEVSSRSASVDVGWPVFVGRVKVTIRREQPDGAPPIEGPVELEVIGASLANFRDFQTRRSLIPRSFWRAKLVIPSGQTSAFCLPRRCAQIVRVVLASPSPASLWVHDIDVRIASCWGSTPQDDMAASLDLFGPRPALGMRFPIAGGAAAAAGPAARVADPAAASPSPPPASQGAGKDDALSGVLEEAGTGSEVKLGPYEWLSYKDFATFANRTSSGLEGSLLGLLGDGDATRRLPPPPADSEAAGSAAAGSAAADSAAAGGGASSAGSGADSSDRVFMGICASNRMEWLAAELAGQHGSFVHVPIMTTASQEVVDHVVSQTGMMVAVAEPGEPLARLLSTQKRLGLPELLVVIDTTHFGARDPACPDVTADPAFAPAAQLVDGSARKAGRAFALARLSDIVEEGRRRLVAHGHESEAGERLLRFPMPTQRMRDDAKAAFAECSEERQTQLALLRHPDRIASPGWASSRAWVLTVDTSKPPGGAGRRVALGQGPGLSDLACVVYTSGSTGLPKGVQRSFQSNMEALHEFFAPTVAVHFSVQPLAHLSEAHSLPSVLVSGGQVGFATGGRHGVYGDVAELEPTFLNTVPAFFNRLHALFSAALAVKAAGAPEAARAAIRQALLKEFQVALGGRLQSIGIGSAPVTKGVLDWMTVCFSQAQVGEGYGSTECGTISNGNKIAEGVEFRLDDIPELGYLTSGSPPRGEILVRTKWSSEGYFRNPKATSDALTDDGFFRTGDVGEQLEDGRVMIIGRRKFVTKLANGEFVSPERIETVLSKSDLVDQVFVDADGSEYGVVAVVVAVPTALAAAVSARPAGKQDADALRKLARSAEAAAALKADLARVAAESGLQPFEAPKAVFLETELRFTAENGLLTGSNKTSRSGLRRKYSAIVKALYSVAGANPGADELLKRAAELGAAGGDSDGPGAAAAGGAAAAEPTSVEDGVRATVSRLVFETLGVPDGDLVAALGSDSLRVSSLSAMVGSALGVDLAAAANRASTVRELVDEVTALVLESRGLARAPSAAAGAGGKVPLHGAAETATADMEALGGWVASAMGGVPAWEAERGVDIALATDVPKPGSQSSIASAEAETVLLTGATGFLGVHLLVQLLQQSDKRVVALARPSRGTSGAQGIRQARVGAESEAEVDGGGSSAAAPARQTSAGRTGDELAEQRVVAAVKETRCDLPAGWRGRLTVLASDIAKPMLGLPAARWRELRDDPSLCVVHCAARVNWLMRYEQLRASNVLGTLEVIRLCASGASRHPLHFVSTISVGDTARGAAESDRMPFDRVVAGLQAGQGGYGPSKWLAEAAVVRAGEHGTAGSGLFVSVHRPGMITAHSQTGHSNEQDFVNRYIAACASLGVALGPGLPADARLDMTPVDFVAGGVTRIALAHGAKASAPDAGWRRSGSCFQYVNADGSPRFADIGAWIREAGYNCEPRGYADFRDELHSRAAEGHALTPLLDFFPPGDFPESLGAVHGGDTLTRAALEDLAEAGTADPGDAALVPAPPKVTAVVIRRTLASLAVRGFVPAPDAAAPAGAAALGRIPSRAQSVPETTLRPARQVLEAASREAAESHRGRTNREVLALLTQAVQDDAEVDLSPLLRSLVDAYGSP